MNNKGFAVSSIMYSILVVFLIILLGILGTLGSRKVVLDKLKKDLKEELENGTSENVWDFTFTGNYQEFVVPSNGKYKVELWGASNDDNTINGSYTSGNITLTESTYLYIYVGQIKTSGNTFNNGDTDLRTVSGNWDSFNSSKSSIMISIGPVSSKSYISGHTGCVAITEDSTENNVVKRADLSGNTCPDNTTDIVCSYHYSDLIFRDTVIIDGEGYNITTSRGEQIGQKQPDGSTTNGHVGNGYARITKIK